MKKRFVLLFLVLAVLLSAFSGCTSRKIANARAAMKYVVHGAGMLNGLNLYGEPMVFTCSNSAEGLRAMRRGRMLRDRA